jgi:hypothetical protein
VKSTGRGIADNYLFYSCVMDVTLIIYTTSCSASIGWGTRRLGWCIVCSMLVVGSGRCLMSVAGKLEVNRIPVMAPISAPILGVHFLGAYFPQKWDVFPLSSHDSSSFKDTCLFIYLK